MKKDEIARISERCTKCGNDGATLEYTRAAYTDSGHLLYNEFIKVTCKTCGHRWHVDPLDKEKK